MSKKRKRPPTHEERFLKLQERYNKQLSELQDEMDAIQEELVYLWDEYNLFGASNIGDKIRELRKQYNKLGKQSEDVENAIVEQELTNQVWSVTQTNSMIYYLDSFVRTIPIMDEYISSGKEFLLLAGIVPAWGYGDTYLVVIRDRSDAPCIKSGLTMSDLKTNGYEIINKSQLSGIDSVNDQKRLIPLCQELSYNNMKLLQNEKHLAFSRPIRVGGQISENRTGYGSIWMYGELVHQGTLYGETTPFLIIGAVIL